MSVISSLKSPNFVKFSGQFSKTAEAYSEPCQTSRMERFVKIANGLQQLTIIAKKFNLRCLTETPLDCTVNLLTSLLIQKLCWREYPRKSDDILLCNSSNSTVHCHDINLTVLFTKWTFDFPRQLLYNFRDQSYNYDELKLEIHYWTKDPPPKPGNLL